MVAMQTISVMVVLPTLGDRPESLEIALASCETIPAGISVTVAVVTPTAATEARQIAQRHGAVVIDDPASGMADAINAAIATRTIEKYYIWLGDDDVLVGAGIAEAVRTLEAHPDAVVAYGHCEYIDESGRVIGINAAGSLARALLPWGPNLIPHPGTVVAMDALEEIGGFTTGLSYALDLDVFLRLRRVGQLMSVKKVTARFRWHSDSLTVADRRASSQEAMKVKASHLPGWLRPLAPVWHWPVAWASLLAAKGVTRAARKKR